MKTAVKMFFGFFVACMAVGAMAADPTISDVVVRQRWPWSKLVDIDYVLTADPTQRVDVAVNAYNGSASLALPAESFSGDLYSISEGLHRIVWDPTVTAYTNNVVLTKFRVGLVQTPVPVYMIVDLTKSAGADGQIEYIYPGDERLETYGRFTNVWFGVTNDSVYATDKLVLRRVHAGSYGMGDSANISTTLTKDFYAGVFEVTQRQWELITGARPSYFNNSTYYATRPVEEVSYEDIRGSVPSVDWPGTGVSVLPSSFVGLLRAKTGMSDFDLPTEAQGECLCRAGTTTYFNDGNGDAKISGSEENNNGNTNKYLSALGRYKFNGGIIDGVILPEGGVNPTNGTATVGSYQANAWGLYATHGNVWEWCLDWYEGSLAGGSDPAGAVSGSGLVLRGGSLYSAALYCRSATRSYYTPSFHSIDFGLRLVRTLP